MDEKTDFYRNFFLSLAERKNNENDLSDITYALCSSSEKFSQIFLNFFFSDRNLKGIGSWAREFESEKVVGSRIDFLYCEEDCRYVIENKINDLNTHDEQYCNAYPDDEYIRAFIANYSYPEKSTNYYKTGTWKDFVKYAEVEIRNDEFKDYERNLIRNYLEYVKNITAYVEIEKMDFSFFNSIQSFFSLVNEIVEKYDIKSYYQNPLKLDNCTPNQIGKWYHDSKNIYYVCIFSDEDVYIQLCVKPKISSKNNEKYFNEKINKQNLKNSFIYGSYDPKEWGETFAMNDTSRCFFDSNSNVESQKKALEGFFDEIISLIRK